MNDALETIRNTIQELWISGDEVFKAMRNTSLLHPENRGGLEQFFAPMVEYLAEIARVGNHTDRELLLQASEDFMAALRDSNAGAELEKSVKAGEFFQRVSASIAESIEARHMDIISKIKKTVHQPELSWLAVGILHEHNEAYAKFMKPSEKSRSRFAQNCKRKGLSRSLAHAGPWKQLRQFFTRQKSATQENQLIEPTTSKQPPMLIPLSPDQLIDSCRTLAAFHLDNSCRILKIK